MMMQSKQLQIFLALSLFASPFVAAEQQQQQQKQGTRGGRIPYIRKNDLPPMDTWKSLNQNVEFIPSQDTDLDDPQIQNMLRRMEQQANDAYYRADDYVYEDESDEESEDDVYEVQPFVNGNLEYDEYQQAWRMLGFMIDCHYTPGDDDDNHHRELSGSWDGGTGEGCQRFVLWAAYVDLEYEGGGIGEYQFYNQDKKKWDDTSCYVSGEKSRCAKMDCHEENTHFSLLGFFKHKSLDDWMEQLFKHEGVCVWSNEQYGFMKNAREAWPQGCTQASTYITNEDGGTEPLYYDVKPTKGGGITFGLYTDTSCVVEYVPTGEDDPITPENVLGNILSNNDGDSHDNNNNNNYDTSAWSLDEALDYWDYSLGSFRICQPCVAYDIQNYGYSNGNYKGQNYGYYGDDYGGNYNMDDFDCYDDADYTNVNQCMKFMAKTAMNTATFRDLSLGHAQGTLATNPFSGTVQESRKSFYRGETVGTLFTYLLFFVSLYVFCIGGLFFYRVRKETNYVPDFSLKQPLSAFS